MVTTNNNFQLLLEQTTYLYNLETQIAGVLPYLKADTSEAVLIEGINRESEENKRQCSRLEGLIAVLNQPPHQKDENNFSKLLSVTIKRIAAKHTDFGYKTAIFVALAMGQYEIAGLLQQAIACKLGAIQVNA